MAMSDAPARRTDDAPDGDDRRGRVHSDGGGDLVVERTRTGTMLAGAVSALVLALLMLVFVIQNGEQVPLEFLWLDFRLPAGVAVLLGGVVGGLLVAFIGVGRVVQLRMLARRHRRADAALGSRR